MRQGTQYPEFLMIQVWGSSCACYASIFTSFLCLICRISGLMCICQWLHRWFKYFYALALRALTYLSSIGRFSVLLTLLLSCFESNKNEDLLPGECTRKIFHNICVTRPGLTSRTHAPVPYYSEVQYLVCYRSEKARK